MSKSIIKTTFRGDLSAGVVSNVQIIELIEFVDDATGEAIVQKEASRPATPEELASIVTAEMATLAAANAELTAQNDALQEQAANLTARLQAAVNAVVGVAHADASWDASVRAAVEAVIAAEVQP